MSGLPSWFGNDKRKKQIQNERSRKQESDHARTVGGRRQAGSGSSWRAQGDVRSAGWLDELKFTDKDSYRLRFDEWEEIRRQAIRDGREPRFVIECPHRGIKLYVVEADA